MLSVMIVERIVLKKIKDLGDSLSAGMKNTLITLPLLFQRGDDSQNDTKVHTLGSLLSRDIRLL